MPLVECVDCLECVDCAECAECQRNQSPESRLLTVISLACIPYPYQNLCFLFATARIHSSCRQSSGHAVGFLVYLFIYEWVFTPMFVVADNHFNVLWLAWMSDECTRHHKTFLVQMCSHLAIEIWNRMTASVLKQDPNTKRLFILTRTDSMQIFGKIPLCCQQSSKHGTCDKTKNPNMIKKNLSLIFHRF